MEVQIIRASEGLYELEKEWGELLANSSADTIFLTWEWITCWLEVREHSMALFVLIVRDDDHRLTAIAPLYKTTCRFLGAVDLVGLRVLGDHASGAEYSNFIIRRDAWEQSLRAIETALLDRCTEWD